MQNFEQNIYGTSRKCAIRNDGIDRESRKPKKAIEKYKCSNPKFLWFNCR